MPAPLLTVEEQSPIMQTVSRLLREAIQWPHAVASVRSLRSVAPNPHRPQGARSPMLKLTSHGPHVPNPLRTQGMGPALSPPPLPLFRRRLRQ